MQASTKSFGGRLRAERQALGMTQERFAELGGVKRLSQHLYEQDVRVPDANYLARLAEGGADVAFLITGSRASAFATTGLDKASCISAYRAVDELARDENGHPLPLEERARYFGFVLALLERESPPSSLDELKAQLKRV